MKLDKLFPIMLIVLDLWASVACFINSDPKRAIYWIAAAVLNVCVTF